MKRSAVKIRPLILLASMVLGALILPVLIDSVGRHPKSRQMVPFVGAMCGGAVYFVSLLFTRPRD
jgi:hypothetical protein